jgi:predicted ATPase
MLLSSYFYENIIKRKLLFSKKASSLEYFHLEQKSLCANAHKYLAIKHNFEICKITGFNTYRSNHMEYMNMFIAL